MGNPTDILIEGNVYIVFPDRNRGMRLDHVGIHMVSYVSVKTGDRLLYLGEVKGRSKFTNLSVINRWATGTIYLWGTDMEYFKLDVAKTLEYKNAKRKKQ